MAEFEEEDINKTPSSTGKSKLSRKKRKRRHHRPQHSRNGSKTSLKDFQSDDEDSSSSMGTSNDKSDKIHNESFELDQDDAKNEEVDKASTSTPKRNPQANVDSFLLSRVGNMNIDSLVENQSQSDLPIQGIK